jgi:hypothetical protein
MEEEENEFEGIVFPAEKSRNILQPLEEKVVTDLMYLTETYKLNTRVALNEFLTRIFLKFNLPLHQFVDNYFRNGNILELNTRKGALYLNIPLLEQWIGIERKYPGDFSFIGRTTEFLMENECKFTPSSFIVVLRSDLKNLTERSIKDAETVAQFFTDMIDDTHFLNYSTGNIIQYSREPVDYNCFELKRAVMFDPMKSIDRRTVQRIRFIIGPEKLVPMDELIESSEEDRLIEIIRIGFGIKNGYIDPRGQLYGYNKSVDPYFFFIMSPVMDVFLRSKTFMDLYHYWSMCDWMDLLPEG